MSSGGEEDYYCSDRDSLDDALENEDSDSQWAPPKGSSSKVFNVLNFLFFSVCSLVAKIH